MEVTENSVTLQKYQKFQIVNGLCICAGQKARINLARALYRDADIVIMDDPLSAVDSRVSRHIFDKCVRKYLRGRLRILATHQLQYLPFADHVIVLKKVRDCVYQAFSHFSLIMKYLVWVEK